MCVCVHGPNISHTLMKKVLVCLKKKIPRSSSLCVHPRPALYHCDSFYLWASFACVSTRAVYLCQTAGKNSIGEGRGALFTRWQRCKGDTLNRLLAAFHKITRAKCEPPSQTPWDMRFGTKCTKLLILLNLNYPLFYSVWFVFRTENMLSYCMCIIHQKNSI